MVERLLSVFPAAWATHFIVARNHVETGLVRHLKTLRPDGRCTVIDAHKQGPGFALLSMLDTLEPQAPVLVTYCDYGMQWDPFDFERFVLATGCDAAVIAYRGFHPHYLYPEKYAYCRMQGDRVVEVKEKGSFTENRENEFASSGGYYFKSASLLKEALNYQLNEGLLHNGESYTSLTVEALLRMTQQTADVRVYEIQRFFQWGTPRDVRVFEHWERAFAAKRDCRPHELSVDQFLMPMAGFGSRFKEISDLPKPLIPVNGSAMFQAAAQSLPRYRRGRYVYLEKFATDFGPLLDPKIDRPVLLQSTPPGQALTTLAGLADLDPGEEVLISSCDHGVVLPNERWSEFREFASTHPVDAAIFTVKGYPGADRKPTSYAYVGTEGGPSLFETVSTVSVKTPINTPPSLSHLLVGTFWFRSVEILKKGIQELEQGSHRVNGELYLDSVFSILKAQGFRTVVVPLEGYLCWGDPDSLKETEYWRTVFAPEECE